MLPVCATGCTSDLPAVAFDQCNPETHLSEITRIFLGKRNTASFTNWLAAGEWVTRLSSTANVTGNELRPLTVIGDKPAPSPTSKDLSARRKKVIDKAHTVNFTIDEATQQNHDFMRAMECGGVFTIWYETVGGRIYGGNGGIKATIAIDMVLARGEDNQVYNGTATWQSQFTEEQGVSPIAVI